MALSEKDLNEIGFFRDTNTSSEYYSTGQELQYNTKNNQLFYFNDGFFEKEFLCITQDITLLMEMHYRYEGFDYGY